MFAIQHKAYETSHYTLQDCQIIEIFTVPTRKKTELMPLLKSDNFDQDRAVKMAGEKIPRTHLLLNLGQLVQENFPLPIDLGTCECFYSR